jgi:putative proteasome-type protease
MSYSIVISVNEGLLFCSDSRSCLTDQQIITHSKLFQFNQANDRKFVILTDGNPELSQKCMHQLYQDITNQTPCNLHTVGTIAEAADYIGGVYRSLVENIDPNSIISDLTFLLGGQIQGSHPRAVKIYSAGNNITSSRDRPFLQIGEGKYGTPILERIINRRTSLDTAALCALVSMSSTIKCDASVGSPIEMVLYYADSFELAHYRCFDETNEFLQNLNRQWEEKLLDAFNQMPPLAWASNWEKISDKSSGVF